MTCTEIFELVAKEIKQQKKSKFELAQKMGIHPSTVQGMYRRKSIPLHRLLQLSEILNYNFFQHIAEELNISTPAPKNSSKEQPEDKETIQKLQGKIEMVQELYKEALAEKK